MDKSNFLAMVVYDIYLLNSRLLYHLFDNLFLASARRPDGCSPSHRSFKSFSFLVESSQKPSSKIIKVHFFYIINNIKNNDFCYWREGRHKPCVIQIILHARKKMTNYFFLQDSCTTTALLWWYNVIDRYCIINWLRVHNMNLNKITFLTSIL